MIKQTFSPNRYFKPIVTQNNISSYIPDKELWNRTYNTINNPPLSQKDLRQINNLPTQNYSSVNSIQSNNIIQPVKHDFTTLVRIKPISK